MSAPPQLPPELERFGGELVAAATRRAPARARSARRARLALATLLTALTATSLAAATGLVPTPWEDAPRAVVYTVVADGGRGEAVRCSERERAAVCDARGEEPPLTQLAARLTARGVETGRITLVRLCRTATSCRTVPAREARRAPADGELVWVTDVALRPPTDRGARITAFTPGASRGTFAPRTLLMPIGGPAAGRTVECRGEARVRERVCRLQRELTRRGVLDVAALLDRLGATALAQETARRCPLTGNRPCTTIDPARARALVARPEGLAAGEAVVVQRQVMTRGFAATLAPPRARPPRR